MEKTSVNRGRTLSSRDVAALVRLALAEDLGAGDVTTDSIVFKKRVAEAAVTAKEPLVVCGLDIVRAVFKKLDPKARFEANGCWDGRAVSAGADIVRIKADSAALLKGERTALNILQRLSGIATLTRRFVEKAGPVTVLDTRKTTPGLRVFEKYAVRCGGGCNHRFGLFDAVLIKDNHIKAAGSITRAVALVRKKHRRSKPVEVETTCLDEVREAVAAGADIVMLDNMDTRAIRAAVRVIGGQARTEVSGCVTLDRLAELAGTGIDYVSAGALTHSARAMDISMNFL